MNRARSFAPIIRTALWVTCPVSMTACFIATKSIKTACNGARSVSRALCTVTAETKDLNEAASSVNSTVAKKTVQAQGTGAIYDMQSLKGFKAPKKVYKQVEVRYMETCLLYSVGGEAQFCIGRVTTPALLVPFTFSWIQLIIMDFSGASKDATSLQRIATIQGFAKAAHRADPQLLRSHKPYPSALSPATARVTRHLFSYGKTKAVHVHQELPGLLPHPSAAVSMQWTFADLLQDMQDQFELLQGRLSRRSNSVAALKQQLAASVSRCEGMSADNIAESAAAQAQERRVTTQLREAEAACKESEAAHWVLKGQLATAHHQNGVLEDQLATAQNQNGVFLSEQLEAAAKLQQQAAEMEQQKQVNQQLQAHLRASEQQVEKLSRQLYIKRPQAAAEVEQRHEGQMAALSAQVAAAQKEAAMQQEFCSGASRRAASLDVMLSNAQKALHDERTRAQTKAREIRSRVEAEYAELRQQDPAAKKPVYVMSEVMKKEVSEVLLHAKTLSAKEGKAFIMQLRMKFHPDKNQWLTKSAEEIFKALQGDLD